jgi:predicted kinase
MVLIIFTGPTASGKSTVSTWLSDTLDETTVYHSAELRRELNLTPEKNELDYEFDLADDEFVESVSKKVYDEMRARAARDLEEGKDAILDGSHRLRQQRLQSYQIGFERSEDVVLVKCVCSDEEDIRKRLSEREQRDDPFAEATEFETYQSTINNADSGLDDPPVERGDVAVIEYDSAAGTVDMLQQGTVSEQTVTTLVSNLTELMDEFKSV